MKRYLLFSIFLFLLSARGITCDANLENFDVECKIQDEYKALKDFYQAYDINIEDLTGYKSLRLIKDEHWYARKSDFECRPWDFYNPKPKSWLYWEKGNFWVDDLFEQLSSEGSELKFDKQLIKRLHLGAIDQSLMGPLATLKGTSPGAIRSKFWQAPPGFKVKCDEHEIDSDTYKLLKDFDLKDAKGDPLITLAPFANSCTVENTEGANETYHGATVIYSKSRTVERELDRLFEFTNKQLKLIDAGESDISPIELMADVQRWYISIHPFGDGNGRTSRYLQDLFSKKFNLPYQRGGFLQHDVFVDKEQYRKDSILDSKKTIEFLKECSEFYKAGKSFDEMSCECRPLYSKNNSLKGIPTAIFVKDEGNNKEACVKEIFKAPVEDVKDFEDLTLWLLNNNLYDANDA